MSFYWDPLFPESRFDRLEVSIGDNIQFESLDYINVGDIDGVSDMQRRLLKLSLYVSSKVLTDIQLTIFLHYYIYQHNQKEIGRILNISQPYVSYVLSKCAEKIKNNFDEYVHERLQPITDLSSKVIDIYHEAIISNVFYGKSRRAIRLAKVKRVVRAGLRKSIDLYMEIFSIGEHKHNMKDAQKFKKALVREVNSNLDSIVSDIIRRVVKIGRGLVEEKNLSGEMIDLLEHDYDFLQEQKDK